MIKLCSVALLAALLACGCTSDKPAPQDGGGKTPASTNANEAATTAVYDVKCGCSIDGVGKCGNFVMIEGKYVPLIHPSLGKMEFCKQKDAGAKIEAAGAMADGKFVAEHWKLVKQ